MFLYVFLFFFIFLEVEPATSNQEQAGHELPTVQAIHSRDVQSKKEYCMPLCSLRQFSMAIHGLAFMYVCGAPVSVCPFERIQGS